MKLTKYYIQLAIGFLSLLISVYFIYESSRFFQLTREILGKYFDIKWVLIGHIIGGSLSLLIGLFQLWDKFRTWNWKLHRNLGKIYIIAVFTAGLCALYLASTVAFQVNWMYAFSLHILASVWLLATIIAYWSAIRKKFKMHEEWMIRSYIITVAFVAQSLSFKLPFISELGSFAETAPTIIWTSWTVPLFFAEFYFDLNRKRK